ncbi:MAG: hypothetical protein LAN61_09090 [Acidobacteriia bacterium]|nr:hypothetical protein [Terriglobia bacterium]
MGNWLRRKTGECRAAEDWIQNLLNSSTANTVEAGLSAGDPGLRGHLEICRECRAEFEETLAVRQLVRQHMAPAKDPGAFFAGRVMRAVAQQEATSRATSANPWHAVLALAERVAMVSALVLVLATTWLYETRAADVERRSAVESMGASLDPAPPPADEGEVLTSLAEREP